jgi:hypothetical protein
VTARPASNLGGSLCLPAFVQCLLLRGEGVEQRETRLARDVLVVPLHVELDRDGDLRVSENGCRAGAKPSFYQFGGDKSDEPDAKVVSTDRKIRKWS